MKNDTIGRRTFLSASVAGTAWALANWPGMLVARESLDGYCDERFNGMKAVFERGFESGDEVGGALAVMLDGELVADLWGGWRDPAETLPWQRDTLVCTMSVSKGIVATCAHMLANRGALSYDRPVADYWPEFAQGGKGEVTVEQLLAHLAALPVADAAPDGAAMEWEPLVAALEVQEPIWPPGTKGTYHATTYGHLVGELVRRVSGKPIDQFVDEELAGPLGVEFIFGCDDQEQARVAPPIANPENELTSRPPRTDDMGTRIYRLLGERSNLGSPQLCRAMFPSASGVSNARSLATIFGALACGGHLNGVELMNRKTLELATEEQWAYPDPIHHDDFRVTMGYLLSTDFTYFGPGAHTFGTAGSGGYTAFADPDRRIGFSYTPNRFVSGHGNGKRTREMIDALYAALD